jgi:hypothetical protein
MESWNRKETLSWALGVRGRRKGGKNNKISKKKLKKKTIPWFFI